MLSDGKGLPEFVADISSNILMKVNKFGFVLFVNNKAKCVFSKIDINKSLKFCVQAEDWCILNKNIEIALYNQYLHNFYWEYQGRFYIVYVYPEDVSLWLCFEDITEKRHLSHLLYINSLRTSVGEKFSKSGYWELDLANKKFYWSDGVYNLFEIDNKDSNANHKNLIRDLILPQDMFLYKKELKNLLKYKKDISGYIRILTKNNKIKKCRFGAGVFYENGEEKIAGTFVDIGNCNEENCKKCVYLSENFKCMLAKFVHDLRQPITAMEMLLKKIEMDFPNKDNVSILRLEEICNNLNYLISETLQVAKNSSVDRENFDLRNVVIKICDEYKDKFENKNIKLILKLDKCEIYQNLFLVEKIVRNLVDNALKYTKTKVLIKNINNCFFIIDNGIGIDKTHQKQIFSDFFQSGGLTPNSSEGVGLGLGIVKDSAFMIGAKLKIKSSKNAYTLFRLCL